MLWTIAIILSLAAVPWIVRPPLVGAKIDQSDRRSIDRPTALSWIDAALALDPRNERARVVRARLRLEGALETWNLTSLPLVRGSIEDYRTALAATPVDPYLHGSKLEAGCCPSRKAIEVRAPGGAEKTALRKVTKQVIAQVGLRRPSLLLEKHSAIGGDRITLLNVKPVLFRASRRQLRRDGD